MRILVHEFVSGGGLLGRSVPPSLRLEGSAIRRALLTDLKAIPGQKIVTTLDPRFPLGAEGEGVEAVLLGPRGRFDRLLASVDAACLVAPETGGCLASLAARAEESGTRLLGSSARAVEHASDKGRLALFLDKRGIPHPETRVARSIRQAMRIGLQLGFPLVVKPARGAGCLGVRLARRPADLPAAIRAARRVGGPLVLQRYVNGTHASVSVVSDGRRSRALAVNSQSLVVSRGLVYRGGLTPLDHPMATAAARTAERVCRALRGVRGFVGVDMVLTNLEAFVIEVNPRFTTAYLGVRACLPTNVAELVLEACEGTVPSPPPPCRRVRFTAGGRIRALP